MLVRSVGFSRNIKSSAVNGPSNRVEPPDALGAASPPDRGDASCHDKEALALSFVSNFQI
jgi:hypothetical protein